MALAVVINLSQSYLIPDTKAEYLEIMRDSHEWDIDQVLQDLQINGEGGLLSADAVFSTSYDAIGKNPIYTVTMADLLRMPEVDIKEMVTFDPYLKVLMN